MMNRLSPTPECETLAYLLLEQKGFAPDTRLFVPAGYEAAVWKNPFEYALRSPGEHPLDRDLPRRRLGIGRSELTGSVGFLNKSLRYALSWGTGARVAYQDPTLQKSCEAGFSGTLALKLDMSDVFLQYARKTGAARVALEDLARERLPAFSAALNLALRAAVAQSKLDFRGIARCLPEISSAASGKLREVFLPLGLWMDDFNIENCIFPDEVEEMLR